MKPFFYFLLWVTACTPSVVAQNRANSFEAYKKQKNEQFKQYKKTKEEEFKAFRATRNAEFAEYLKGKWEPFDHKPPVPQPLEPEPKKPVIWDPKDDQPLDSKEFPIIGITKVPTPLLPALGQVPETTLPLPISRPKENCHSFSFYQTKCEVRLHEPLGFSLSRVNENAVASVWATLSKKDIEDLLSDCLEQRNALHLCDYAFLQYTETLSQSLLGGGHSNEAVLLQAFLLTQMAYNVKMGTSEGQLVLLYPVDRTIYEASYFQIDGKDYYIYGSLRTQTEVETFRADFSTESQVFSLALPDIPDFALSMTEPHIFMAKKYPEVKVSVSVNKNALSFFESYPHCDWSVYALAPMSTVTGSALLSQLTPHIKGKSEEEAANILINFVQTAFAYQTDAEQFGYERTFFADELFYYPFSDCEDRAVLYVSLIRQLLGLKSVLLHYPDHLACAIHLSTPVHGDYVVVAGERYLICDPTFIGSPIGRAMPQYREVAPEVIQLSTLE